MVMVPGHAHSIPLCSALGVPVWDMGVGASHGTLAYARMGMSILG